MKKYRTAFLLFLVFEALAVVLWQLKDSLFLLFNFSYIGVCLGVGSALTTARKRFARLFVQLTVGSYILIFLGLICHENMQIEGFWFYLFSGVVGHSLYCICAFPYPCYSALLGGRGHTLCDVSAFRPWQHSLLCGWHRSCHCLPRQPCLLQIHLSDNHLTQADESLFVAAYQI